MDWKRMEEELICMIRLLTSLSISPSTYGDKVVSIAEVSETELMVSLYTKGIFLFNKKTHKYRPFYYR